MSEQKIYKPRPISGFPEYLPEVRLVEQQWLDHIRRVFESYGFCSIETPAVEEMDVLVAKGGETEKEIYVLERLHKEEGDKESRLALHFDQTVPMARYVAQHFNELTFPFKRYQMQKVWRGERPQAGRFREFMQCDIDVVNIDNLPLHFDAEIPAIIWEVLSSLPGMENEKIQIRISNRKILLGFLEVWRINNKAAFLSLIDKKEKMRKEEFDALIKQAVLDDGQNHAGASLVSELLNKILSQKYEIIEDLQKAKEIAVEIGSQLAVEGFEELIFVMNNLKYLKSNAVADLSIVRGLDYYTGTVYETVFIDNPAYGSICSGGRYDDLAGNYINKHLPGVGISIGFSRLFDRMRTKLPVGPSSPAQALILLLEENQRAGVATKAKDLRAQGYNIEMYHSPAKIQKQFSYAEKKGIPFVFVPMDGGAGIWEIKNMASREQKAENPGMKDLHEYVQKKI